MIKEEKEICVYVSGMCVCIKACFFYFFLFLNNNNKNNNKQQLLFSIYFVLSNPPLLTFHFTSISQHSSSLPSFFWCLIRVLKCDAKMELSETIPVPSLHHESPKLELGLQSSSPKSDLDPPPPDLNHAAELEDELQNLDLREMEERYSSKEEESESDDNNKIKSEVQSENENENQMRKRYPYPVRPEAGDCAYYMKTGTCKFGSNCKFNHPIRRKNQVKS